LSGSGQKENEPVGFKKIVVERLKAT